MAISTMMTVTMSAARLSNARDVRQDNEPYRLRGVIGRLTRLEVVQPAGLRHHDGIGPCTVPK